LNAEEALCKLLVERGADASVKRNDGETALHAAALCVLLKIMMLLSSGICLKIASWISTLNILTMNLFLQTPSLLLL
jgi:ankyrin repeat protein